MAQDPFTRIIVVLPIPLSPEHSRVVKRVLDEMVSLFGGVTFSPQEPPSFFGMWEDDHGEVENAKRMLVITDARLPLDDPLLNAYLDYLKIRCQRELGEQIIWMTMQSLYRISTYDNVM